MRLSRSIFAAILIALAALAVPAAASQRFYSPSQQFLDGQGNPYAGGLLYFYASGTSTPLNTYSDAALAHANPNPITLDSAGRAGSVFLGPNAYKVVLTDSTGNQIWTQDPVQIQPTAGLFIGGTTTGAANAQVLASVSPTGFSLVQGYQVNAIAGFTNTGATTLNVTSTGNVALEKPTGSGLAQLTGGELVSGQTFSAIYDGSEFVLTSMPGIVSTNQGGTGQSNASLFVPTGSVVPFAGLSAPTGWLLANGQAVSRSTYSALEAVITINVSGTISGGTNVNGLSSTTGLTVGQAVEAASCPSGETIAAITSSTSITLSAACTNGAAALQVFPYGNGDGVTTFNLPDLRGSVAAGLDNMGGTAANRLQLAAILGTTAASTSAGIQNGSGYAIGMTVSASGLVAASAKITGLASTSLAPTGNTHTSTTIDGISSMTGIVPGLAISGTGVPAGDYITAVNVGASTITLAQATTSSNTGITIAITGYTATLSAAASNSGTASARFSMVGDAQAPGQIGGAESQMLAAAEVPSITFTGSTSGTSSSLSATYTHDNTTGSSFLVLGSANPVSSINFGTVTIPSESTSGTSSNTGGQAHGNVQPTLTMSYIIKT